MSLYRALLLPLLLSQPEQYCFLTVAGTCHVCMSKVWTEVPPCVVHGLGQSLSTQEKSARPLGSKPANLIACWLQLQYSGVGGEFSCWQGPWQVVRTASSTYDMVAHARWKPAGRHVSPLSGRIMLLLQTPCMAP